MTDKSQFESGSRASWQAWVVILFSVFLIWWFWNPFSSTQAAPLPEPLPLSSQPLNRGEADQFFTSPAQAITPTLTYTVTPQATYPGQPLVFDLSVTNTGSEPMTNVVISDTFPSELVLGQVTVNPGAPGTVTVYADARNYIFSIPELAPGQSGGINIQTKVSEQAAANPNLSSQAQMRYDYQQNSYAANSNTLNYRIASPPAVSLVYTVQPHATPPGNPFTFTLQVTNESSEPIQNAVISDTFPSELTLGDVRLDPASAGTVAKPGAQNYQVSVPTLTANETITVTIHTTATEQASLNTDLSNQAKMSYVYLGESQSASSNTVEYRIANPPKVNLEYSVTPETSYPGNSFLFNLVLSNESTEPITNAVLTDSFSTDLILGNVTTEPSGAGNVSTDADTSTYTVTVPSLSAGGVLTVTIPTTVDQQAQTQNLSSQADLTYQYQGESFSAGSNTIEYHIGSVTAPTLNYQVTPNENLPGGTFTFTLSIKNEGSEPYTDIKLTDIFSDTLDVSTVTVNPSALGTATKQSHGYQVAIGSLPAGQTGTITIVTTVNSETPETAEHSSQAQAAYKYLGVSYSTQSNTVTYTILSAPAPGLTYSVDPNGIYPGQYMTFKLVVKNNGNLPAENIYITDTLTNTLTLGSESITTLTPRGSVDVVDNSHAISATIPTLSAGASATITFRGTLGSSTNISRTLTTRADMTFDYEGETKSVPSNQLTYRFFEAPTPDLEYSVTPREQRKNRTFTFTIKATNDSNTPITDVRISTASAFSSYLDLESVDLEPESLGTVTTDKNARTFSVSIAKMDAGEDATITIVTTVNNQPSTNLDTRSTVNMVYKYGTTSKSISDSADYRILGTSTLPGTGWGAPPPRQSNSLQGFLMAVLAVAGLLMALGTGSFLFSFRLRKKGSSWSDWLQRTGLMLVVTGFLFGLAFWGLAANGRRGPVSIARQLVSPDEPGDQSQEPPLFQPRQRLEDTWVIPDNPDLVEKLPDFPVPTPSAVPTQGPDGGEPDTSPVTRLLIPILGVDNVVKFVPYDGLTWMIAGLREEIAWLGETSWPGLGSNTVLAGHITLRGGGEGPFRYLEDLQPGDQVRLYTEKNIYTYQVRDLKAVEDTDISVVKPTSEAILTLITCTDYNVESQIYQKRLIVSAELQKVNPLFANQHSN